MPDLREVFEMVKQQTEPDLDSWSEQERRMRSTQRKRKYGALALVAALALVVTVVVASNLEGDNPSVPPASSGPSIVPAVSELALVDIATGATTGTGIVPAGSEVDVSPDGTLMTYVDATGAVAVANVDGSDPHPYVRTISADDPTAPRWSPDGHQIVYQGVQNDGTTQRIGNLYVLDVANGRVEQITDLPTVSAGFYYMAPTFSADGTSVLFTRAKVVASGTNGRTYRWDLWTVPSSGGAPTMLLPNAGFADAEPGGDSITFVQLGEGHIDPDFGDLFVAKSDGTEARKVADGEVLLPRWSPDGSEIAYEDLGRQATLVVDVATGDSRKVLDPAEWPEWVDQQTLIVDLSD
jgi:Tol biopolymer transport system component